MKKLKNEIIKFTSLDLKNKQTIADFYNILNKKYVCGELFQNLILNPNKNSSFLYYEHTQNELILGFKDTNHELYQNLLKIKDSNIFGEEIDKDENISYLIKDIRNYSYIKGGALITFHKKLLLDYINKKYQNDIKKVDYSLKMIQGEKNESSI